MLTKTSTSRRRLAPVRAGTEKRGLKVVASPSLLVVGVGASAGGLEAFIELLRHLPTDTGMSFVLVQHLDPTHTSLLPQLLAPTTAMSVCEAVHGARMERNAVYVIPPNHTLSLEGNVLKLQTRTKRESPLSIDGFFESLAENQGEKSIGVILSGNATDGTLGLEAIKAAGGITFAQDASAKHDSMPRSAVAAGCVDFVLSPAGIGAELARIAKHPLLQRPVRPVRPAPNRNKRKGGLDVVPKITRAEGLRSRSAAEVGRFEPGSDLPEPAFEKILRSLRTRTGVDFSLYKPTTIYRRIARRMVLKGRETLEVYEQFLRENTEELDALYGDFLIGVTSFFRNPDAFDALKRVVFRKILTAHRNDAVRIWTLGCSTGQEAYSLAIAFLEFCDGLTGPVPKLQIFATDLNEAHLEKARLGYYASLAATVSAKRLQRFFIEEPGGHRVNKSLREICVFARQNVISDPPFSRMDLISCRNLMIYLDPELQKQLLPAFHYALRDRGFLFLGSSETVGPFTTLFASAHKKHRIYEKKLVPTPSLKLRFAPRHPAMRVEATRAAILPPVRPEINAQREADRLTLSRHAPPGVVIDASLQIIQFRGKTSRFLQPVTGRANCHLLKMARDGLLLPLRAVLAKARKQNAPARSPSLLLRQGGETQRVTIEVTPLKHLNAPYYLVCFETDAPEQKNDPAPSPSTRGALLPPPTKGQAQDARRRVATLELELSETREYLHSLQEQHDAATQEVQASTEEVQSANEELQSINEELETSKEELVSSFEELTTVNEEMSHRNTELNRLNADLNNLHVSLDTPILVLGPDLSIRRFTTSAATLLNLLPGDIGRNIEMIRNDLDLPNLKKFSTDVMESAALHECEVTDRSGRWYLLRGRPYLDSDDKIDGTVLVLLDIDRLKRAEEGLRASEIYFRTLTQSLSQIIWTALPDGQVDFVNDQWQIYSGQDLEHVRSSADGWTAGVHPDDRERAKRSYWEGTHSGRGFSLEVRLRKADGNYRWFLSRASPLRDEQGRLTKFLGTSTDIEDIKRAEAVVAEQGLVLEKAVVERTAELRETVGELEALSYGVSHDMRAPLRAMRGFAEIILNDHGAQLDREGLVYLQKISAAARRMDTLIDDVLTYTRILRSELKMRSVDLSVILHEIMDTYPELQISEAEIVLVEPLPSVLGHDASLTQVFSHLLSNAVKFVSPGTKPQVKIHAEDKSTHVRIWIDDNGVGIATQAQQRIFSVFERVSPATAGNGIGLAVVRKAVRRMSGDVGVESSPGGGSKFWVELLKAPKP